MINQHFFIKILITCKLNFLLFLGLFFLERKDLIIQSICIGDCIGDSEGVFFGKLQSPTFTFHLSSKYVAAERWLCCCSSRLVMFHPVVSLLYSSESPPGPGSVDTIYSVKFWDAWRLKAHEWFWLTGGCMRPHSILALVWQTTAWAWREIALTQVAQSGPQVVDQSPEMNLCATDYTHQGHNVSCYSHIYLNLAEKTYMKSRLNIVKISPKNHLQNMLCQQVCVHI